MQYTTLADALLRAKERSGATEVDDIFLTELLVFSAGKAPDGVNHYRPFLVAARWLEQNRAQQAISEAEGAKFTGLATPIASLLQLQLAYDRANELTVPQGFEAIPAETAPTQQRSRRFGSASHTPKLSP